MLHTPMLKHSLYYLWLRYTARGVPVHCVMICDLITLDSGTLYDSLMKSVVVYCHVTVNLHSDITIKDLKHHCKQSSTLYTIFLRMVVQLCIRLVLMVIPKLLTYSLMPELQWMYRRR